MPFSSAQPADEAALLDLFAGAKLSQAPSNLKCWYSQDELRAQLRADLAGEVERVFSDDLAALFHQHVPVAGVISADAYKNRVLDVPGLGTALVGIRFRGLDLARPFVTVAAHTASLPGARGLREAAAFLHGQYAAFSPKHVRVFVPAGVAVELEALPPGSHWDVHLLAAPLAELRARPFPPRFERVTLEVPADLAFYPRYAREYETLFESHPEHRDFARIESKDDLAEYRHEGLLFEVRVDGAPAGVVAATRSEKEGLRGFVVVEMFLDGAHRGRGWGPAVGRHLIERLPAEVGDALCGTIHHDNAAARRSAERGGREDVGAFLWVGALSEE